MNESQILELGTQHKLYLFAVKPLIAEVEVYYQRFPNELFNEIRAFNDHVARCFSDDASNEFVDEQLRKAKGHIHRILLDCYKFINVFFYRQHERFEKQTKNINLLTIQNGKFFVRYKGLLTSALNSVREAKIKECTNITDEDKFKYYENSTNAYRELITFIDDNRADINLAKRKFWAQAGFKVFSYILAIILGWILTTYTPLAQVFNQIFK